MIGLSRLGSLGTGAHIVVAEYCTYSYYYIHCYSDQIQDSRHFVTNGSNTARLPLGRVVTVGHLIVLEFGGGS